MWPEIVHLCAIIGQCARNPWPDVAAGPVDLGNIVAAHSDLPGAHWQQLPKCVTPWGLGHGIVAKVGNT